MVGQCLMLYYWVALYILHWAECKSKGRLEVQSKCPPPLKSQKEVGPLQGFWSLNTVATRLGIPLPSPESPTLCIVVDIVRWKLGRDKAARLLQSVDLGSLADTKASERKHSAEQVNKALANPCGGLMFDCCSLNSHFNNRGHLQTWAVIWHFWKTHLGFLGGSCWKWKFASFILCKRLMYCICCHQQPWGVSATL